MRCLSGQVCIRLFLEFSLWSLQLCLALRFQKWRNVKEDLTRRNLQRATALQPLPKKKKKTGAKSKDTKLVVNSSESGQRQVISQSATSIQAPEQGSHPNRFRKLKGRGTRIKNRDAGFCQVCWCSSLSCPPGQLANSNLKSYLIIYNLKF